MTTCLSKRTYFHFISFNTCNLQAHLLSSIIFHLRVDRRNLPNMLHAFCQADLFTLALRDSGTVGLLYPIAEIISIIIDLSALLPTLVSKFSIISPFLLYINYLAAELIGQQFYMPKRRCPLSTVLWRFLGIG